MSNTSSDTSLTYPKIVTKYHSLLSTADNKDISFVFENSSIIVKAHKLILEAISPVFKAMLSGSFMENNIVTIRDISPEAFQKVINAVYLVPIEITSVQEAAELYNSGEMYELDDLKDISKDYMLANCRVANCFFLYEKAKLFQLTDILEKCEAIFQIYTTNVLVHNLCIKLEITESTVMNVVAKHWKGKPGDLYQILETYVEMGILKEYKHVICTIDFVSMDVTEILAAKLFTTEEKFAMISCKEGQTFIPLPPYFSQNRVNLKPQIQHIAEKRDLIWIALLRNSPNIEHSSLLLKKYVHFSEFFKTNTSGKAFKDLFEKQLDGAGIKNIKGPRIFYNKYYSLEDCDISYDEENKVQVVKFIYSINLKREDEYHLIINFNAIRSFSFSQFFKKLVIKFSDNN